MLNIRYSFETQERTGFEMQMSAFFDTSYKLNRQTSKVSKIYLVKIIFLNKLYLKTQIHNEIVHSRNICFGHGPNVRRSMATLQEKVRKKVQKFQRRTNQASRKVNKRMWSHFYNGLFIKD